MPRKPNARKALAIFQLKRQDYYEVNPGPGPSFKVAALTTNPIIARVKLLTVFDKFMTNADNIKRSNFVLTNKTRKKLIRLADDDTLTLNNIHSLFTDADEVGLFRHEHMDGDYVIPLTLEDRDRYLLFGRKYKITSFIRTELVDMPSRLFRERLQKV